MMREQEALLLLQSLIPGSPDVYATTGIKETGAYLLLKDSHDLDRWAVVYSPGDRYFSLQTEDRYWREQWSEDLDDDEVREILEGYVKIGLAYVLGGGEIVRSGFLGTPVLTIQVGDHREELRAPFSATIASIFKPFRRSTPNSRRS